jgi:hypothetical protein
VHNSLNLIWLDIYQSHMKIQLERNLNASSGKLSRCQICEGACRRARLRTMLCRDDGTLVGDICKDCVKQPTSYIHHRLHHRAAKLLERPLVSEVSQVPSPQKQALVLAELTYQPLHKPPFYIWWWKRLTISIAEARELERARSATPNYQLRLERSLEDPLSNEETSISDTDRDRFGRDN